MMACGARWKWWSPQQSGRSKFPKAPARLVRRIASIATVFLFFVLTLLAQTSQDQRERQDADSFFHSVAATIYTLAWPTATFKKAEFSGFQRVSNGIAVVMKLSGVGLFGDNLWLKLGVVVNKDGIQDIKVIDHDALFAGPFETTKAMRDLIVELDRRYSQQQTPAPIRPALTAPAADVVAAVCLVNASNIDLNFSYRWGAGQWTQVVLKPSYNQSYFWRYQTSERISPNFEISYDDNLAEGLTERRYNLERSQAHQPVTCDEASRYQFRLDGSAILLESLR